MSFVVFVSYGLAFAAGSLLKTKEDLKFLLDAVEVREEVHY